ncbi:hypothetical protein D779_1138 [Imhoffiella purpurea]|uniref:Uncharacterized protein n=1 Tax=Imhoffiella purpurea TaxID=1249627 RepID=W9VF58_9GAMM|nr:hypothetical protein D779_1138 [Imhoffiella purpurea]
MSPIVRQSQPFVSMHPGVGTWWVLLLGHQSVQGGGSILIQDRVRRFRHRSNPYWSLRRDS